MKGMDGMDGGSSSSGSSGGHDNPMPMLMSMENNRSRGRATGSRQKKQKAICCAVELSQSDKKLSCKSMSRWLTEKGTKWWRSCFERGADGSILDLAW
ncbi:hypothetical protein E4U32_005431 [Claviceps aff. humidiphila group G2b]|nr:hypothetical protein E4U32_005431 [Claviceps aff. humidiphila group G2b]